MGCFGTADMTNVFRLPYGSGWALVGDAGHPKDPMHARGIREVRSRREADFTCDVLVRGLRRRSLAPVLRRFERSGNVWRRPLPLRHDQGADLGIVGSEMLLDFNYAYNPSCAYDERWSCPLSPPENRLPFAVNAGEKIP